MHDQVALRTSEWSEPIIVLGKGIPDWSKKYSQICYCVVGIGEASGWVRYYPFVYPEENVELFEKIRVVESSSGKRPQDKTRKIGFLKSTGKLEDECSRKLILAECTETGDFLHDNSYRRGKTVGVIKPLNTKFRVSKNGHPRVRYKCNSLTCKGHDSEVFDFLNVDRVGRRRLKPNLKKIFERIKEQILYFVMGTHLRYPHRWLLVSIHNL